MPCKQIYLRAAELVSNGWTQGTNARDIDGDKCSTISELASSFCSLGALSRAAHDLGVPWGPEILDPFYDYIRVSSIANWNDSYKRTKDEVVQVLEKIAELQGT